MFCNILCSVEINYVVRAFSAPQLNSKKYAGKQVNTKQGYAGQSCHLEYWWSQVDHPNIFNCPGPQVCFKDLCATELRALILTGLTRLLWRLWVSWWSWGCAGPWQSSKSLPHGSHWSRNPLVYKPASSRFSLAYNFKHASQLLDTL